MVLDGDADADAAPDWTAGTDGEEVGARDDEAGAEGVDGDAVSTTLGDAVSATDEGVVVTWPPGRPTATGRV